MDPQHIDVDSIRQRFRDDIDRSLAQFVTLEDGQMRQLERLGYGFMLPESNQRDGEAPELRVSIHFDLTKGTELARCPASGECMAPSYREGDVAWYDCHSRTFCDGDEVLYQVGRSSISGDDKISKFVHRFDDRLLLISRNDPPLRLDERFKPLGVMVAFLRYPSPLPRSPERQAQFDREEELARQHGYAWSEQYLRSVLFD